jgi:hypothetical protein
MGFARSSTHPTDPCDAAKPIRIERASATHRHDIHQPGHTLMPLLAFGEWRPDVSDYEAAITQNVQSMCRAATVTGRFRA